MAAESPKALHIRYKSPYKSTQDFLDGQGKYLKKQCVLVRTGNPIAPGTAVHFQYDLADGSPVLKGNGTAISVKVTDAKGNPIAGIIGISIQEIDGASRDRIGPVPLGLVPVIPGEEPRVTPSIVSSIHAAVPPPPAPAGPPKGVVAPGKVAVPAPRDAAPNPVSRPVSAFTPSIGGPPPGGTPIAGADDLDVGSMFDAIANDDAPSLAAAGDQQAQNELAKAWSDEVALASKAEKRWQELHDLIADVLDQTSRSIEAAQTTIDDAKAAIEKAQAQKREAMREAEARIRVYEDEIAALQKERESRSSARRAELAAIQTKGAGVPASPPPAFHPGAAKGSGSSDANVAVDLEAAFDRMLSSEMTIPPEVSPPPVPAAPARPVRETVMLAAHQDVAQTPASASQVTHVPVPPPGLPAGEMAPKAEAFGFEPPNGGAAPTFDFDPEARGSQEFDFSAPAAPSAAPVDGGGPAAVPSFGEVPAASLDAPTREAPGVEFDVSMDSGMHPAIAAPAPAGVPVQPAAAREIDTIPVTGQPPHVLLQILDGSTPARRKLAVLELAEMGEDVANQLFAGFPYIPDVDGVPIPNLYPNLIDQYHARLTALIALGQHTGPGIAQYLAAPSSHIRAVAVSLLGRIFYPDAVREIAHAAASPDPALADLAVYVLTMYRDVPQMKDAVEVLRQESQGANRDRALRALGSLGKLRSPLAFEALLDHIDNNDEMLASGAEGSLDQLTGQSLGRKRSAWEKWYNKNRGKRREEWLIDGLGNKDEIVREIAISELKALTGRDFGFDPAAPGKERDAALKQWKQWLSLETQSG